MPTWKPGHIDCLGIRSALGSVARLSSPLLWDPWNGKQSKHFTCQAMASTTLHHLSLTYISTFFLICKHFHSTTLSCSPLPNLNHGFWSTSLGSYLSPREHISHPILHKLHSLKLKRQIQVPFPLRSLLGFPRKWHLPALGTCQLSHSIITLCLGADLTQLLSSAKLQVSRGLGSCLGQLCGHYKA